MPIVTPKLIINNQEMPCISGKQMMLIDPSTGKEWYSVDEADSEDVEVAVKHAEAAWPTWSATHAAVKAATMRKFAGLIRKNAKELAEVEARTMGRPVSLLNFDLAVAPAIFDYIASLVETAHSTLTTNTPGLLSYTLNQPYGVTAGIIPWNVPMLMFAFKVAPAVGAGNAIIIKSSEKAPLTPLMLGKLAVEAGFPPGLIQVLSGYGPTVGATLARHMKIRKISFTGSLGVGRLIQKMSSESNLKAVTLELGGKSPTIVFPDADLPSAAKQLAHSILMYSGQSCMCTSRLYIHSSIAEEFTKLYQKAIEAQASVIGSAMDEKTTHGPQVDKIQHDKIKHYIEVGKTEGNVLLGGQNLNQDGFFIQPTVFTDVKDDAVIVREEIFGPVSVLSTFETEEEAIQRANDSEYGLYASVFSKNINRATRVASALDAGSVGVNCTSPTLAPDMPFGGYKQSGLGRELGPSCLYAWKQTKSVFVKLD